MAASAKGTSAIETLFLHDRVPREDPNLASAPEAGGVGQREGPRGIASGQSLGNFTRAMLDEMNAQHAKEHANCTKTETIALLEKGVAAANAVVRGLTDDQLAKSGTVFTDAPPMTAEQVVDAA